VRGFAPLLLAALAPLLLAQAQPVLVPDVSQKKVEIIYSFTGAELLLFGAILYPGGKTPNKPADIAVVLKGPFQPITIREKQKVAGIWVNAQSARFRSAPTFYAVASSRPLEKLIDERTASIFELGLGNLQLSPASGDTPAEQLRFEAGLIDLRKRAGLYAESPNSVKITDEVLYRARLAIPARVPVGNYTAETYLIQGGRVIAAASLDVEIHKSGFERYVASAAQDHPISYGLIAVVLSVVMGWLAGVVFRRF